MLFEQFTRSKTKLLLSRMDIVKSTGAIISYKAPMGTLISLMLLLRRKSKAESKSMVQFYKDGGLVFCSMLILVSSLFNIYFFHLICRLQQKIRVIVEDEDLKLDYTEIFYYFSIHKMGCKKFMAKCLMFVIDVVIIFQGLARAIFCMLFALREIAVVANKYGNDFSESSLCWYLLVPVFMLLLIGNYKMLAIAATVGNCATVGVYGYLLVNCSKGVTLSKERKLFPDSLRGVVVTVGRAFQENCLSFAAVSVRNEMRRERDFDKLLGTLNWSFVIMNFINILLPGMCYMKYGTPIYDTDPQHYRVLEMTQLLIAMEQIITIAIHIYIPFHIVFPAIYRQLRPTHVVRLEVLLKALIAVFLSLWAQFLSRLDLSYIAASVSSPVMTFVLPPIYELADGDKHGFCKKLLNVTIIIFNVVQICWASYYWFRNQDEERKLNSRIIT